MEQEIQQLKKKMQAMEDFINSLKSSSSIPMEIDSAFRDRLVGDISALVPSTVSPTTHNKAVNEAGSASYSVMNIPTGFIEANVAGVKRVIPYF